MAAPARDDWKLCAEWLVTCKILPPDHKAVYGAAEALDLVQSLRDGVLLCHLLNILKPGCIDLKDFSQRPQMSQFLCLKNIRIFLQTCKKHFLLSDDDLFDSYDLFECSDFSKVLNTLSKLSKSAEASKSGIPGFPPSNITVRKDTDYYNTLQDKATDAPIDDEPLYDKRNTDEDEAEQIYGEVIYGTHQSIPRRAPPSPATSQQQPDIIRGYCIKELVETESNYVEALKMIITHFIEPMRTFLSVQEHGRIFMGIEELHKTHTKFSRELKVASSSHPTNIGNVFLNWKKSLLIYGDFCSNLPLAQELVDELCKKSPVIQEKITLCQQNANDGKFRLRDLLSVPMQRVLKYHLLLQELKKKTDRQHSEYTQLEKALETMQDLSLYVNEVKRDNETLQLIEEIQNSIVDLQMPENLKLRDYGKLLKDGELRVVEHPNTKKSNRYIFLFDKVMLMCKSRMVDKLLWGETYGYKSALNLAKYDVDEAPQLQRGRAQHWNYIFMLVPKDNQKVFTCAAKTEDSRRRWIQAIDMAKENTCPFGANHGGHNFVLHTFVEPKECDLCRKMLRGVFFQGYKCPKCTLCSHKECLPKMNHCSIEPPVPGNRWSRENPISPQTLSNQRRIGKCKANFAYHGLPQPSGGRQPLIFSKFDVIEILSQDTQDWWKGRLHDSEGYFPPSYVTEMNTQIQRLPSYEEQAVTTQRRRSSTSSFVSLGPSYPTPMPDFDEQWYVGEMSRENATTRLEKMLSGTYLIRKSCNETRKGEYSLSIKYGSSVKQIKVNRTADERYYLADCTVFRSIPELVDHYQRNSLEGVFPQLNTTLVTAYKDSLRNIRPTIGPVILGYCIARFDYAANQPNQLSLKREDRVAILSKAGEDRGWWKGRLENGTQVGYFPLAYVVEEGETDVLAPHFGHP